MPTGDPRDYGFMRDEYSQAIVCADLQKRDAFMRKRSGEQRIANLESDLKSVKNDIVQIKNMLSELLQIKA